MPQKVLDLIKAVGGDRVRLILVAGESLWRIAHPSAQMAWRFLPLDPIYTSNVELLLPRDLDSRITEREKWCFDQWLPSGTKAYSMHDSQSHVGVHMLGGMIGFRGQMDGVINRMNMFFNAGPQFEFGLDQQFLQAFVYPLLPSCQMYGLGGIEIPVPYPVTPGHIGCPDGCHSEEEKELWRVNEMEALCR